MPSGTYQSKNRKGGQKGRSGIYKRTKENRMNLSKAHKGKSWGRHSEDTKRKMSLAKLGNKNPQWRGGEMTKKQRGHRIRIINAEGFHTIGDWGLLKKQYGYTCPCCKKKEPEIKLTEDHIIPLSKGGSNYIENIQSLCRCCNSKKRTKIIDYNAN
jgi:5-methylcytosine-specific restriction endonuclease McrA